MVGAELGGLQDAKLHTLRWHLLPRLGAALAPLARAAGAPEYADHYLRDLGPAGGDPFPYHLCLFLTHVM